MNKYETAIIINNEITEEQDLGEKRLAYEVNKHNKGYYYLIKFNAKATCTSELERIYRITDEILKFIVVREN